MWDCLCLSQLKIDCMWLRNTSALVRFDSITETTASLLSARPDTHLACLSSHPDKLNTKADLALLLFHSWCEHLHVTSVLALLTFSWRKGTKLFPEMLQYQMLMRKSSPCWLPCHHADWPVGRTIKKFSNSQRLIANVKQLKRYHFQNKCPQIWA